MKIKPSCGCYVGKRGGFVKEQDQARTLPEVRRCGARVEEASGLGEKLIREDRAMKWRRARHETIPGAVGQMIFSDDTPSIGRLQSSVTLPLFAKWTTQFAFRTFERFRFGLDRSRICPGKSRIASERGAEISAHS
jgi:hypothetical protein